MTLLFYFFNWRTVALGLPRWRRAKEFACHCRRHRFPVLGRCPAVESGNPLQYSCLENSMNRGIWWTTAHRVAKSQTRLSTHALSSCFTMFNCTIQPSESATRICTSSTLCHVVCCLSYLLHVSYIKEKSLLYSLLLPRV